MKLSLISPKRAAALAASAPIALAAFAAFAASGCAVTTTAIPAPSEVAQVSVQPGATMTAAPGSDVGLFVQYDTGGHWQILTTCDTSITQASCTFDVTVTASSGMRIHNVKGLGLAPADSFIQNGDGSVNLVTATALGSDGLSFDADPGAIIQVDLLVNGVSQPRLMHVRSEGQQLDGVPSNPVDLRPEAP